MWLSKLGRWIGLGFCAVFAGHGPLNAEMMTLNDPFGRSINADVIELDDDVLKIKREDGMFFDMPLNRLSEEDQKKVREWATKEAAREAALPLPDHAFEITVSRTKFDYKKPASRWPIW